MTMMVVVSHAGEIPDERTESVGDGIPFVDPDKLRRDVDAVHRVNDCQ